MKDVHLDDASELWYLLTIVLSEFEFKTLVKQPFYNILVLEQLESKI
jgi:hypothetical protein